MKLKKDWSLAYFIYYICLISYWVIIISVCLEIFISIGHVTNNKVLIRDIPVNMELEQFEPHRDIEFSSYYINIPERVTSDLHISGEYEEVKRAFWFYNGFKLYENIVYFILLFLLSKVLKNVAEDDPFHSKNPSYLYTIGWVLFMTAVINIIIQYLLINYVSIPLFSDLTLSNGIAITSYDLFGDGFIEAGIVIIVLGYVFKEGARIYEEQKLTV